MRLLFATTLFVSAALLFLVQPLLARMVLPLLGGAPAVWNTCMVFFQAALLLGYGYAHALVRIRRRRLVIALHLMVMLAALLVLPIVVASDAPAGEGSPVLWLLG